MSSRDFYKAIVFGCKRIEKLKDLQNQRDIFAIALNFVAAIYSRQNANYSIKRPSLHRCEHIAHIYCLRARFL